MIPNLAERDRIVEEAHHRGEGQHPAHLRALLEMRAARPASSARFVAATLRAVWRERHSLTNYPCRLPDGLIGRTAAVQRNGEWVLVCSVA
jgi:predicted nucleic acid-binding protein